MKTYNGKNITKKHIASVLRTENPTEIFRLYHIIFGGKVEKSMVHKFIKEYAPTVRVYKSAYNIAYGCAHRYKPATSEEVRRELAFREANIKHYVLNFFRSDLSRGLDGYTKRPMTGRTHLYFCSPVYGHSDYNKWRAMPIKGNERFCELLCRLADKYFPVSK